MARFKLIAAIVVGLFAMVLEAEASWHRICIDLSDRLQVARISKSRTPAEEYEIANSFIKERNWLVQMESNKLMSAWKHVVLKPDECNDESLRYVSVLSHCILESFFEATKKYVHRCFNPDYIEKKIESRSSSCFLTSCAKAEVKLIDDQFLAEYFADNPDDMSPDIRLRHAIKFIARAISRLDKEKVKDNSDVMTYLDKLLFNPCSNYVDAYKVVGQLHSSENFIGGVDLKKLIASLNKDTQKVVYRYLFCWSLTPASPETRIKIRIGLRELGAI